MIDKNERIKLLKLKIKTCNNQLDSINAHVSSIDLEIAYVKKQLIWFAGATKDQQDALTILDVDCLEIRKSYIQRAGVDFKQKIDMFQDLLNAIAVTDI